MDDSRWVTLSGVALTLAFCILVRLCVGLHPYSGQGLAPRFGDYEAQRHWMEVTINLPLQKWYVNSPGNDLQYWGLDYPPLTAYQAWAYGKVFEAVEPQSVALGTSRGYETAYSKLLMRWSVVASDALVFLPAVAALLLWYYRRRPLGDRLWALALACLQPPLLLIDHGHFQYNTLSLGFAAAGAGAAMAGADEAGAVLYCLALNHKQMALYYAPAFFAYMLGKALRRRSGVARVGAVARLGVTVAATFAAVWWPFLWPDPRAAGAVLARVLPVHRGLYEDYVANWWCASSLAVKWRHLLSQRALVRLCAALTAAGFAPSLVQQVARPSRRGFMLALFNSSMAFFLFSYMVHEKSILLPLLPASLLALHERQLAAWLPAVGALSMFPLLLKDGLVLPYAALLLLWGALVWPTAVGSSGGEGACGEAGEAGAAAQEGEESLLARPGAWRLAWRALVAGTIVGGAAVHAAHALVPPPARYPFIYDAAYTVLGFVNFAFAFAYTNRVQWGLPADVDAGGRGGLRPLALKKVQ